MNQTDDKHGAWTLASEFDAIWKKYEGNQTGLDTLGHWVRLNHEKIRSALSARSATAPIDLKKLSALLGMAELHLMGWRNSGGGYANTEDVIQRLRAAEKELESARTEIGTRHPDAYIEHHKGGNNLVWDETNLPCTPLYKSAPAEAVPSLALAIGDMLVDPKKLEQVERFSEKMKKDLSVVVNPPIEGQAALDWAKRHYGPSTPQEGA